MKRGLVPLALLGATLFCVPMLESCRTTQPAGTQMSDAGITSKIKAKYVADPEINPFNISVSTEEGVVYLTGRVHTQEDRDEAEKLARETEGVRRVVNNVQVGAMKENPPPPDK